MLLILLIATLCDIKTRALVSCRKLAKNIQTQRLQIEKILHRHIMKTYMSVYWFKNNNEFTEKSDGNEIEWTEAKHDILRCQNCRARFCLAFDETTLSVTESVGIGAIEHREGRNNNIASTCTNNFVIMAKSYYMPGEIETEYPEEKRLKISNQLLMIQSHWQRGPARPVARQRDREVALSWWAKYFMRTAIEIEGSWPLQTQKTVAWCKM